MGPLTTSKGTTTQRRVTRPPTRAAYPDRANKSLVVSPHSHSKLRTSMLRYLWCGSIETTRNMHPQAGQDGHSVRGLSHDFGGGTCVLGMIGPWVAGGSKSPSPSLPPLQWPATLLLKSVVQVLATSFDMLKWDHSQLQKGPLPSAE